MRTIGRRWKGGYGDYQANCDICGVAWLRSKLVKKVDGLLYCPDDVKGRCALELDRAAAKNARRQPPPRHLGGSSDAALETPDPESDYPNFILDAGPDIGLNGPTYSGTLRATVDLNGIHATDYTVLWTQTSGSGTITFDSPTSLECDFTIDDSGDYEVTITLSSALGTLTDTLIIAALGTLSAGADQTVLRASGATLTATSTLSLDTTYLWHQISGPGTATFAAPTSLSTTVSVPSGHSGEYEFEITATDEGFSISDRISVTFIAAPSEIFGSALFMYYVPTDDTTTMGTGVSQLDDESGQANHVTQSTPASQPARSLTGGPNNRGYTTHVAASSQRLRRTASVSGALQVGDRAALFAVARASSTLGTSLSIVGIEGSGGTGRAGLQLDTTNGRVRYAPPGGGTSNMAVSAADQQQWSYIAGYDCSDNSTKRVQFNDTDGTGTIDASEWPATGATGATTTIAYGSAAAFSNYFGGDIAGVWGVRGAITAAQASEMREWVRLEFAV